MKEKNNLVLKFFILLSAIVFGLGVTKSAQATEVTDYTNNVTITKNGSPLTSDTTVTTNETLAVTSDITFPDSQAINSGDTLTLKPVSYTHLVPCFLSAMTVTLSIAWPHR